MLSEQRTVLQQLAADDLRGSHDETFIILLILRKRRLCHLYVSSLIGHCTSRDSARAMCHSVCVCSDCRLIRHCSFPATHTLIMTLRSL